MENFTTTIKKLNAKIMIINVIIMLISCSDNNDAPPVNNVQQVNPPAIAFSYDITMSTLNVILSVDSNNLGKMSDYIAASKGYIGAGLIGTTYNSEKPLHQYLNLRIDTIPVDAHTMSKRNIQLRKNIQMLKDYKANRKAFIREVMSMTKTRNDGRTDVNTNLERVNKFFNEASLNGYKKKIFLIVSDGKENVAKDGKIHVKLPGDVIVCTVGWAGNPTKVFGNNARDFESFGAAVDYICKLK